MMASQAYYTWDAAGRPWKPARPIAELQAWAQANGVTVLGTIGNEEHLQHVPPQDHTPYSATAWPVKLSGYIVTAIDLDNVRELGQLIEDGARAGEYPWLKYMNHDNQHLDSRDLDGDGITWEEYPSSDKHVHISIRTDWIDRSIGTFDPFGGDDSSMFCKYGEKSDKVKALQLQMLRVNPAALPNFGPDGGYGDETATWVSIIITGGDGKTYGPQGFDILQALVAQKEGGDGGSSVGSTVQIKIPESTSVAAVTIAEVTVTGTIVS